MHLCIHLDRIPRYPLSLSLPSLSKQPRSKNRAVERRRLASFYRSLPRFSSPPSPSVLGWKKKNRPIFDYIRSIRISRFSVRPSRREEDSEVTGGRGRKRRNIRFRYKKLSIATGGGKKKNVSPRVFFSRDVFHFSPA